MPEISQSILRSCQGYVFQANLAPIPLNAIGFDRLQNTQKLDGLNFVRQMLKAPPVNPRAYISWYPKLDPGEGR